MTHDAVAGARRVQSAAALGVEAAIVELDAEGVWLRRIGHGLFGASEALILGVVVVNPSLNAGRAVSPQTLVAVASCVVEVHWSGVCVSEARVKVLPVGFDLNSDGASGFEGECLIETGHPSVVTRLSDDTAVATLESVDRGGCCRDNNDSNEEESDEG